MLEMYPGREVYIASAGLAMARLKLEVEAGNVPGIVKFNDLVYGGGDGLHLNEKGAYIVCLLHYACIYGESPRGASRGSLRC